MKEALRAEQPHSITMENRASITVTGVLDVGNFDDGSITLKTGMGELCIRGNGLHISAFDVSTGELTADGRIVALVYTNEQKNGGFFSRVFK